MVTHHRPVARGLSSHDRVILFLPLVRAACGVCVVVVTVDTMVVVSMVEVEEETLMITIMMMITMGQSISNCSAWVQVAVPIIMVGGGLVQCGTSPC